MFYHNLNPVIFKLGMFEVRWYGVMYLIGIIFVWWFVKRYHKHFGIKFKKGELEDLIFYLTLGMLIGGRIGYIIFYNFRYFWTHPADMIKFWQGGMSFHGGLILGILTIYLYSRRYKKDFMSMLDVIAVPLPLTLALGRVGNFINGELWGRPWNSPYAFIFPAAGNIPRYPSQLFEVAKNLVIFSVMFYLFKKKPKKGIIAFSFLTLYGILRITIEFFREPEIVWHGITMGQILSIPMVLFGIAGIVWVMRSQKKNPSN